MAQLPVLSPFAASLGAGATMIGIILAAYSLANMVGNVGAGPLIDRYGRKVGIVGGMATAGIAVALYAVVASPGQLVALRVLHGVGGAVLVPAAFAYAGDGAASTRVGRSMGYSGAAVGIAALIGPAAGGLFRTWFGARPLFITLAALLALTAVLVTTLLPESYHERSVAPDRQLAFRSRIVPVLRSRPLRFVYLALFFVQIGMGALAHSLPLRVEALGFSAARTGALFSVFSLVAIALFLSPVSGLSDRYGRRPFIRIGLALLAAGLGTASLSSGMLLLAPAMVLYGAGYGFAFPALCSVVVDQTDHANRGTGFGVFYAVFSLGVATGPIVAGLALDAGFPPLGIIALLLLLAQLLLFLARRSGPRRGCGAP